MRVEAGKPKAACKELSKFTKTPFWIIINIPAAEEIREQKEKQWQLSGLKQKGM